MNAKSKFWSTIKSILSIFFIKKRQGWIFSEKPSLRNFEISDAEIIKTILILLILGILWISLAFFVGISEAIQGKKIIFISISIFVLFLCLYVFETQDNDESNSNGFFEKYKVRLLSLSLIIPPLLIVYISQPQEQISQEAICQEPISIGIIVAITVLLFHLLYWSLGLSKEIEGNSIFIKISSISMLLSIFSQTILVIPDSIKCSLFKLFPYYLPFLLFWHSTPLKLFRLIGFIVVFVLSLAYSINVTIKYTSRKSIEYIHLKKIASLDNTNLFNKIYNSFAQILNGIFIPISELFIHLLNLTINYFILISINFFKKITEVLPTSIKLLLLFIRFLILPLSIAGCISFLIWQASDNLYYYIHNYIDINDPWLIAFIFISKYLLALVLIPFCLLISWSFEIVLKTTSSFIEIILMPNILLFMILPVFSLCLRNLNFEPYYFGFLSKISMSTWIILAGIFIITTIKKSE